MSQEYYSVLARTIVAAGQDHAQLRGVIYQLARVELRTELSRRHEIEMEEQVSALEKAINQLETDVVDDPGLLTITSEQVLDQKPQGGSRNITLAGRQSVEVVRPEFLAPIDAKWPFKSEHDWLRPAVSRVDGRYSPSPPDNHIRATFWWNIQLIVATLLGVAIYAMVETHGDLLSLIAWRGGIEASVARQIGAEHSGQGIIGSSAAPTNMPSVHPTIAGAPLPDAYGVYAVDHGKLTDLASLPIKVPNQRVGISAMISTPSASTLPDGRLRFVAFRRDLINNAPDRVMVRVVARVMRALTFDAKGRPSLVNVEGSWAVRGNAYEMKVAPLRGNPEMIVIEPENPDFSFPSGRYAMVLQGAAYDFSIAGPITDTAQCLERTDAVDMPVYSECSSR